MQPLWPKCVQTWASLCSTCASLMGPDLPAPTESSGGAAASLPLGGSVGTSRGPGGKSPPAPSAEAAVRSAEPSAAASAFCPFCSRARPEGRASQKASSAAFPQMAAAAAMRAVKLHASLHPQPCCFSGLRLHRQGYMVQACARLSAHVPAAVGAATRPPRFARFRWSMHVPPQNQATIYSFSNNQKGAYPGEGGSC